MAPSSWSAEDDVKLLMSMLLASTPRPLTQAEWADAANRVTSMGKTVTHEACRQHYAKLKAQYNAQAGGASTSGTKTGAADDNSTTPKNSPVKRKLKDAASTSNENTAKRSKAMKAVKAAQGVQGEHVGVNGKLKAEEEVLAQPRVPFEAHRFDGEDEHVA